MVFKPFRQIDGQKRGDALPWRGGSGLRVFDGRRDPTGALECRLLLQRRFRNCGQSIAIFIAAARRSSHLDPTEVVCAEVSHQVGEYERRLTGHTQLWSWWYPLGLLNDTLMYVFHALQSVFSMPIGGGDITE